MSNPQIGKEWIQTFSFSQDDVIKFAQVTGDHNPLHLDADYAAKTRFKQPIMHGFLSGSILSKFFGTVYPGEGTIYLSQQMIFKRPMFVDMIYSASFRITGIDTDKHILTMDCKIMDDQGKICLEGDATILNDRIF